jgi:hypothetical protein
MHHWLDELVADVSRALDAKLKRLVVVADEFHVDA